MKKFILMLATVGVCDSFAQDTIQVELNDKAKVVVTAQDRESLRKLQHVDFNKTIKGAIRKIDTAFGATEKNNGKTFVMFGREIDQEEGIINIGITNGNGEDKPRKVSSGWIVDLGLNNYMESNGNFPEANNANYRLQMEKSVYVGVGKMWHFRIGGEKSPVSIRTGLMADWYNFRFVPQNYITSDDSGVLFSNFEQDFGKTARKSKMVVPYIQVPLMVKFRVPVSDKVSLKLGLGGYMALRTGGRTKVNVGESEKIKDRDSFYMNTWRYGLEGNVGINNYLLFVKYDLNPLFVDTKGPKLNPISFGIRL